MSTVVMHAVASLDGYIADEHDEVGPLFDWTNGWEAQPPAGEHLIVVSHRSKPEGWHPEADVPFFDDVAAAVTEARTRAGDRVVALCAGDVGGQALALGLVD